MYISVLVFAFGVINANNSFSDFMSRMIPLPKWDNKVAETKTEHKRGVLKNDAYETLADYLDGSFNGFVRFINNT